MKLILIMTSVWVFVFFVGIYAFAFATDYETKISGEEVTIKRFGMNPFTHSEYSINLETGKERIWQHAAPFFGSARFITYERDCQCVTRVHVVNDHSVSVYDNDRAIYASGKAMYLINDIVPYDQVSHLFEDALATRNKFWDKYADILSR